MFLIGETRDLGRRMFKKREPVGEGRVNEGNIWRVLRETSPTILVERASLLSSRAANSKRGIFSQEG